MKFYKSEYVDFTLFVSDFKEGALAYAYGLLNNKKHWYECVVNNVKDIPGVSADFEGEFDTGDNVYFVGLDVVKVLKNKPDITVIYGC